MASAGSGNREVGSGSNLDVGGVGVAESEVRLEVEVVPENETNRSVLGLDQVSAGVMLVAELVMVGFGLISSVRCLSLTLSLAREVCFRDRLRVGGVVKGVAGSARAVFPP